MTILFLASCSIFWAKLNLKDFKVTDIASANEEINLSIKNWSENYLKEIKEKFYNYKKNKIELTKEPKVSSKFHKYSWKNVNSIIIEVEENILNNFPEKFVKNFYTNKDWKEIFEKDIFKIDSKHKKNILTWKLRNKIENLDFTFKDTDFLNKNIENFLNNLKFYIDWEKVVFIFEPNKIANFEKWIIEIKFDFNELYDILNDDFFPEVKEELKRRAEEEERRKKEALASWKNISLSEAEALAKNNWKKYVALTFDDGPNNKTTPQLLDILKKHDVKATFFVLWRLTAIYPDIVKREFEEWHEVANHTWDHPNLTTQKDSWIKKQISDTDREIKNVIWKNPNLFRPPYWAHNQRVDNIIWGKTIIMWNVDSMDWKHRNVQKNLKAVLSQVNNWSIILFHDIHQATVDTIEPLIKELKKQGYEFLTVSELLEIWQNWDFSRKTCHSEFRCISY